MADCSCLSCITASAYIHKNIKFVKCSCCYERLANNYFQCLETQIIVDISFINCDLACSRYKVYSCD